MKKLFLLASFALAVAACSATKSYVANYPATDETMARLEAGAVRQGCEFDKVGVFGWAAGMRQAEVTCPDGREIQIVADSREYGDRVLDANTLADTTSFECDGTLADDEVGCKAFMDALWSGAVAGSN